MKTPHILALTIIALCMVVTLFAFSGAVAQHVDIPEAMTRPGETVQVPGQIVKETVTYDAVTGELRFDVIGIDRKTKKPVPSERMTIVYRQPKPENFDSAVSVEAIGHFANGVFVAKNLLVKCPSKYAEEPATAK